MALESMQNQFSGLPMESLIGTPLKAACDAQVMLAQSTVNFIRDVGFEGNKTRTADFSYTRHVVTGKDGLGNDIIKEENVGLEVPVLAIVNIPSLMVDEVDITFDMEVKSAESSKETQDTKGDFSAKAKLGWGPFSVTATVSGSVASHKENTRSSDNSAKYHVHVHASQAGTPEGLSRVLDIIQDSVAPKSVNGPNQGLLVKDDIKKASDAVVTARNELEMANSALKLANMKLEQAKLSDPGPSASGATPTSNQSVEDAEKDVATKKTDVVNKEIALQEAINGLQEQVIKNS
ncbi:DUF2589 domain-containing protein [Aeromonas veronii]|uniref:DUF2589 domain-containing protein n=1 Tax=Aeromonas veronii TaxID=654 RepID=UPI002246A491|nr:DUF2589 domain-containing protein [Aeromonas veronii]EKP0305444.1 DUF2589 domain-containing protein [Aeromonas veronii]MCX0432377.1 DUF2589 domain-containing protein [Aeromonas veronii]